VFSDTTSVAVDSVVVVDTMLFDIQEQLSNTSNVTDSSNFEKRLIQTPTKALFKSMVIPGWGQFGNKKPFKALIFAGMDAWMILSAVHHGKKANDLFDQFESTDDLDLRRQYYSMYLSRKDQRNKFTWFAVIISFVSMFDAYVDAHLSGYPEVEDNIKGVTMEIIPDNINGTLIQFSYHF
jgi:hypothetical protein